MNSSPTQPGLSDIINAVPLVDAEGKPLSKLKTDRMLKAAKKRTKKQIFKWGDVHRLLSLVSEQLTVYENALNDIQNLPHAARVALDNHNEFVVYYNNLSSDLQKYTNKVNAILNKIPTPGTVVTESSHMHYLNVSQEAFTLGEDVRSVLEPVLLELTIFVTEAEMELTNHAI